MWRSDKSSFWKAFPPFFALSNMHDFMKKDEKNSLLFPFIYSLIPRARACAYMRRKIFQVKIILRMKGLEMVPQGMACFHQNPLVCHATKLPYCKPTYIFERIFPVSGSHACRGKSKLKERKKNAIFSVLFVVCHLTFCADWNKGDPLPCDCSILILTADYTRKSQSAENFS